MYCVKVLLSQWLQCTLKVSPTCSSHTGTASCETYVAGQRNLDVYMHACIPQLNEETQVGQVIGLLLNKH